MDLSKMTNEEARAIVAQAQNVFDASIADQQRSSPKEIQSLPLDLTVARNRSNAMKVSFPFKSLLVEQATDLNTYVFIIPISNDSGNDPIRVGLKDVYKNEFGFRECYIYWDAQPSKNMVLKFFVRSNIENGRLVVDSNTNNNVVNLGQIGSSDNGFSYVFKAFAGITPAATYINIAGVYPNADFYQLHSSGNYGMIKVPKGYIAKILSHEFVIQTAVTVTTGTNIGLVLRVSTTENPANETNQLYLVGSDPAKGLGANATSQSPFFIDAYNLNPARASNIVDENQFIYLQKSSGQGVTAGAFTVSLLIRFEPKVGGVV